MKVLLKSVKCLSVDIYKKLVFLKAQNMRYFSNGFNCDNDTGMKALGQQNHYISH